MISTTAYMKEGDGAAVFNAVNVDSYEHAIQMVREATGQANARVLCLVLNAEPSQSQPINQEAA